VGLGIELPDSPGGGDKERGDCGFSLPGEVAPPRFHYVGSTAATDDAMWENFEFLMRHYPDCHESTCVNCARYARLRDVLMSPFQRVRT
jgi:hypothetical protein